MRQKRIICRPSPNDPPPLPLPIQPRSAGYHESVFPWSEEISAGKKPFVQIFWTIRGSGEVRLPSGTVELNADDFFYHLPGEDHFHRTKSAKWDYCWCTFDGPAAADFITHYGYGRAPRRAGECPVKLFSELETLLRDPSPYARRHALAVICEILALAGARPEEEFPHNIAQKFITYAQESIDDPELSVRTVAAELGIHRSTLLRHFSGQFGESPVHYLQEQRLRHALSLLRESNLPIKAVAAECGISQPGYLTRIVKNAIGVTPSQFRKSPVPKT